ncbi:helix-turn-helix transcriptional regulator [Janibacter sp. YB324]|uniref:helix-turn-helix transcriptional regulator n=1 Tax=Janibacter sp. YB324 TaxID=2761047 RepID=UPI00351C3051
MIMSENRPTPLEGPSLPRLLTTNEVARAVQVSPSTLCRWRQSGEGPRVTWLSPFIPRYRQEDVDAWLKSAAA